MANVKVFADKQIGKWTDQKVYASDLSIQGHKKENAVNRHILVFPQYFLSY